jgi:GT2 family glycosyltransferase
VTPPASRGAAASAKVTIVVLTYNRIDELRATLRELCELPEAAPIVVVDNASRDGTPAVLACEFPQLTTVRNAGNLGAAGRNAGVAAVRTPYVAFCDDDTAWQPGALALAAGLLDAHPRLGAIVGRVQLGEPPRDDAICELLADSPLARDGLPGPALLGLLAGASVMRVDAFTAAGGYWPPLFIGGEESLLALDLASLGWRIAYVDRIVTRHRPSQLRDARYRSALLLRNAIWTAWLRLPAVDAMRATRIALADASRGGRLLRVLIASLAGIGGVLRRRRVVSREICAMYRAVEACEWQWRRGQRCTPPLPFL